MKLCFSAWVRAAAAFSALGAAGCGSPAFPVALFTVDAEGADYPVMLSHVKNAPARGRPMSAMSGMEASGSTSSYTAGNTTVTVTQTSSAQSELGAATKLAAQVKRADRWIAVENVTFEATDFSAYGVWSASRKLGIQAKAYR